MKKTIFLITLLFLVITVSATDNDKTIGKESGRTAALTLSGVVTDEKTGELLAGVEVKVVGTNVKTYTDFDGKFTLKNLKPDQYKLIASYISYRDASVEKNISPENNQTIIRLQPVK